jgi:acyl dehydratase
LTPEARALIGTVKTGTVTVLKRDFQRWAAATGDRNPLYFDVEYAKAHGHPDVVMPSLFLSMRLDDVVHIDRLRPDGVGIGPDDQMPLPPRRMAGGERWEWFAPIYGGEVVSWRRELVDLVEKQGRSGPMVQIIWKAEFTKPDGRLAAINTNILLALPLPGHS